MNANQAPNPKTQAGSRKANAGQKQKEIQIAAMRLALYIRELGAEPVSLQGNKYRDWERRLQRQYQELREGLGKDASQAARMRGRALIRREGLASAVAYLLPATRRTRRRNRAGAKAAASELCLQNPVAEIPAETSEGAAGVPVTTNPATCHRKYRHENFLTAMFHARRIHSAGLDVYPCDICGGLHVGHNPADENVKRARAVRRRLRSIDRQLAGIERQFEVLRREREQLLAELGLQGQVGRHWLREYLRRATVWLHSLAGGVEAAQEAIEISGDPAIWKLCGSSQRATRR